MRLSSAIVSHPARGAGLYVPAVIAQIVLDVGRALYVGQLGSIGSHQAAAAALLVGLDRSFEVTIDGVTTTHEATLIPARTDHELEFHGGRVAVLYFEPGSQVSERFDLVALRSSIEGALVRDDLSTWNALLRTAHIDVASAPVEPRIARVAAMLTEAPDEPIAAEVLAQSAGLSV